MGKGFAKYRVFIVTVTLLVLMFQPLNVFAYEMRDAVEIQEEENSESQNANTKEKKWVEYEPNKTGKTTANMYMRSGVGLDYTKKAYIPSGSKIKLYGYYRTEGFDWYYINYKGEKGYVSSKYVKRVELNKTEITKFITTANSVSVYWDKIPSASKYYIYRREKNGQSKKIATVGKNVTSYKDTNVTANEKYYYKIESEIPGTNYVSTERRVTPVEIAAPKLEYVKRYSVNGRGYAKFQWISTKGKQYYIYKKENGGNWKKIATVKAKSSKSSYTDNDLKEGRNYIYTAKLVDKIGDILYKYSAYDKGIATIDTVPTVKVDVQNLNTKVTWKKVKGATGYKIYRKVKEAGKYRLIGYTTESSYNDVYKESTKTAEEKKYLCAGHFVDPSINPYVYTVRAYSEENGKESYSDYLRDGDFRLETPSIVSVKQQGKNATIEWSAINNAQMYDLYTGCKDKKDLIQWKKVKEVTAKSGVRQKDTIPVEKNHKYFTVRARALKNGKTVYSGYDKGFTVEQRKYKKQNVLFLGDSITFGSPYKGVNTREVFSYPWRVQQLTGIQMYNPSIPGATYAYSKNKNRFRLVTDVAARIEKGQTPEEALHENTQTYKDFDVVVMAAGTNDYSDNIKFGKLNSKRITEFNGAVNRIMDYIKSASKERVKNGKEPIKVVFVELFYSDRTTEYSKRTNRFITKNGLGLTLTDYQDNLDTLFKKYKREGVDIYRFDTTEFVNQETCPYVTSDNLHMSRYTYTQIGNKLTEFLIEQEILR